MAHYLRQAATFFRYAWAFSFFINLALLLSPLFMTQVYDRVLTSRSLPTLTVLTVGVCVGLLFYSTLETLRSRVLVQAGLAIDQLLTTTVLREGFERAAQVGGLRQAVFARDVASLRQYLSGTGLHAFFDAPWGIAFLVIIFLCHWLLGAVALAGMVLLLGVALWDHRRTQPLLLDAHAASRDSARQLDAALRHAESVRAMGMGKAFLERWQHGHQSSLTGLATASDHGGTALALSKGSRQLLQALMLATGAYLVIVDNLSSGVMLAATILLGKATAPLELAIGGWRNFVDAKAAFRRLDAMLRDIQARPEAMPLPQPQGALALDGVSFSIKAGDAPLLRGVSFSLSPGECLAVIGPSGAGKSTLLRVLLGIWPPQAGTVRLDGFDVHQWPSEHLGAYVGYLPQSVDLLEGSVATNIARMGDPALYADDVLAAAQTAGAHDMIQRLPSGYETETGADGTKLSGGQRQLVGLSRALFAQPKLLVLDEPNANLDAQGEQNLVQAMLNAKQMGTTVVFVTHKPSLLRVADKVLALDAGRIKAFGPRSEVLGERPEAVEAKPGSRGGADGSR